MEFISKESVTLGLLERYGERLIKSEENELHNVELILPTTFNYNGNWRFEHICSKCKNKAFFGEDFEKNYKNFDFITGIDSLNYDSLIVNAIGHWFSSIEIIEIEGAIYLNRNDFKYDFDFQRKVSVPIINYNCESCQTNYLGVVRIGYPLFPEKNLPQGKIGQVDIVEIINVESEISINFYNYIKSLKRKN